MSVNTAGGSLTSRPGELARAGVNDIFAGLVASVITIAYGLSFAALIFAPPLNTWLAYGIAATFITSAVTAAIVAARSSLPFAIAGPDPTTVAVTATLVSALMARLDRPGPAGRSACAGGDHHGALRRADRHPALRRSGSPAPAAPSASFPIP